MSFPECPPPKPLEPPTLSSQFLLGAQQMDPMAWSRLVTVFGPIVYRWCRASGVRESDAPDLVQDVFAAVAHGIPKFERKKTQGSFRSWLATITRNKVRDHFRNQSKRQTAVGGTQALLQLQLIPDDLDSTICAHSATKPLTREVLQQVESEFEGSTWKAFWLTAVEGTKAADVATALGISIASVYQSKSRVLRRMRERLADIPE